MKNKSQLRLFPTTIKIPVWVYLSFWAITSATFFHLGFISFRKTDLSSSVSPLVNSLFKHSLAIFTSHSVTYALIFNPSHLKISTKRRYLFITLPILTIASFRPVDKIIPLGVLIHVLTKLTVCLFYFDQELVRLNNLLSLIVTMTFFFVLSFSWYTLLSISLLILAFEHSFCDNIISISIHSAIESSMFLLSDDDTKFFPIPVVLITLVTSSFLELQCLVLIPKPEKDLQHLLPVTSVEGRLIALTHMITNVNEILSRTRYKNGLKFAKFAVGLGGTVLFQNYFRFTTFYQVKSFLYLAVSWVANLTLIRAAGDLGVLSFLLGNVIVGCTVNQFGLGGTTWIAYGASLLLYGLRLKLQSLSYWDNGEETLVIVWKRKVN